ncbi:hypothetical protein L0128_21225 [candidate division KSB1 bacterium]|nr:hypothetical protein [candidate division KSB1 bacterium]
MSGNSVSSSCWSTFDPQPIVTEFGKKAGVSFHPTPFPICFPSQVQIRQFLSNLPVNFVELFTLLQF